jgi:NAD(P)H dehydrogenase (quinone)
MVAFPQVPLTPKVSERFKIVVSGASGRLGKLVVNELLKRSVLPEDLILVTRSPDRLDGYASRGAAVRYGDVDDPQSLPEAYAGGTKMLFIGISAGPATGKIEDLQNFYKKAGVSPPRAPRHKVGLDAAVQAGVEHIVYTSMLNADISLSPWAADQRRNEANLKNSGAKWTALRNGIYAEYGVGKYAARMVESGRVTVRPNELKRAFVTLEDCAAAAAGVLTGSGHENKAYEITGPDLVNRSDIAELVSAMTGRKIEVIEKADEPIPFEFSDFLGGNLAETVSQAVAVLAGRPATSMRSFLEEHKDKLDRMPQDW